MLPHRSRLGNRLYGRSVLIYAGLPPLLLDEVDTSSAQSSLFSEFYVRNLAQQDVDDIAKTVSVPRAQENK